jgi:hypothetical protein
MQILILAIPDTSASPSFRVNVWPTVDGVRSDDAQLAPGASTSVSVLASDPEGSPLKYDWAASCHADDPLVTVAVGDLFEDASSSTARFTAPLLTGSCILTSHVTDERGASSQGSLVVSVAEPPVAAAPRVLASAMSPATALPGQTAYFQVQGRGWQGESIAYTWCVWDRQLRTCRGELPAGPVRNAAGDVVGSETSLVVSSCADQPTDEAPVRVLLDDGALQNAFVFSLALACP